MMEIANETVRWNYKILYRLLWCEPRNKKISLPNTAYGINIGQFKES